jgi:hypothetical protein
MDTDKRDPINTKLQIKPFKIKDEFFFIFMFNPIYDMAYPMSYTDTDYYLAVTFSIASPYFGMFFHGIIVCVLGSKQGLPTTQLHAGVVTLVVVVAKFIRGITGILLIVLLPSCQHRHLSGTVFH